MHHHPAADELDHRRASTAIRHRKMQAPIAIQDLIGDDLNLCQAGNRLLNRREVVEHKLRHPQVGEDRLTAAGGAVVTAGEVEQVDVQAPFIQAIGEDGSHTHHPDAAVLDAPAPGIRNARAHQTTGLQAAGPQHQSRPVIEIEIHRAPDNSRLTVAVGEHTATGQGRRWREGPKQEQRDGPQPTGRHGEARSNAPHRMLRTPTSGDVLP